MPDDEIWKDIPGYGGYYKVSDLGRVKSLARIKAGPRGGVWPVKEKILVASPVGRSGHLGVNLFKDGKQRSVKVHKLVLLAFVGPCPEGHQSRHFPDRDTTNNKLSNLSYSTPLVNQRDRYIHGTSTRGNGNGSCVIPDQDILGILEELEQGASVLDISLRYGVTREAIYNIRKGRSWSWLTGRTPNV